MVDAACNVVISSYLCGGCIMTLQVGVNQRILVYLPIYAFMVDCFVCNIRRM